MDLLDYKPENQFLFKQPSIELGQINIAISTMTKNEKFISIKHVKIIRITGAIFLSAILIFSIILSKKFYSNGFIYTAVLIDILLGGIIYAQTHFAALRELYYVGTKGASRTKIQYNIDNVIEHLEFHYSTANDFRRSITNVYENFMFKEAKYQFTWLFGEEIIFELAGISSEKEPKDNFDFYFVSEIAKNWTDFYFVNIAYNFFEEYGYYHFNILNNRWIRIYHDKIEWKDEQDKIISKPADEIGKLFVEEGYFHIREKKGIKGLLGKDYIFGFDEISNPLLFNKILLDNILNIK